MRLLLMCTVFAALLPVAARVCVAEPWPAEPWLGAANLTAVEGPGSNDFHQDLSGAFWNPVSRRLWVCRNGPSGSTSKLWVLREDGGGSWVVDTRDGMRGEWTGFGDFEAVTQADLSQDAVFAMVEGEEVIKRYGVGTYGAQVLERTWNTRPHLPLDGGNGAEGLAFVPDAYLRAAGFTDGAGQPYVSTRGMGGLMFVGHQNGGRVYAFDLDPGSNAFGFVGAYLTGAAETAELALDRDSGHLMVLHGDGVNTIEIVSLASVPVGSERRLVSIATYLPPADAPAGVNLEGMGVMGAADCTSVGRGLFLTVDDGGPLSLLRFARWPCPCRVDVNGSGIVSVQDIFDFLAGYFGGSPEADFNFSGSVGAQDLFDFLAAYFVAC